jgi:hypothetical protein
VHESERSPPTSTPCGCQNISNHLIKNRKYQLQADRL